MKFAHELKTDGITVIPWCKDAGGPFKYTTKELRDRLDHALSEPRRVFVDPPRFDDVTKEHPKYLGAFSAGGDPTVFHNMVSRKLRLAVTHYLVTNVYPELLKGVEGDYYVAASMSRIIVRPPGVGIQKESFHRDLAVSPHAGDKHFGGWLNMDDSDQYFAGVKGTHGDPYQVGGFARIPKEDIPKYEAALAAQAGQHNTNSKGIIVIPPGCFVQFDTTLVHAIFGGKKDKTSVRHFLGCRLTLDPTSSIKVHADGRPVTHDDVREMVRTQDISLTSTSQKHPLVPSMYCVVRKHMVKWHRFERKHLRPNSMVYPESEFRANHPKRNRDYTRSVKSLFELHKQFPAEVDMFPEYEEHEVNVLLPHKTLTLLNPTTGKLEVCELKKARTA